jgi:hypothetical protein
LREYPQFRRDFHALLTHRERLTLWQRELTYRLRVRLHLSTKSELATKLRIPDLFAQKVLILGFLCATSVFSVSRWCGFTRNSSTTETQRTQRLHREECDRDFLCKALFDHNHVDRTRYRSNLQHRLGV